MTIEDGRTHRTLFEQENYPLIPSRQQEISTVLKLLEKNPIVFVWGPAGNGKTGFGREFRNSSPVPTQLILGGQLRSEEVQTRLPFDQGITDDSKIVIVDEVGIDDQTTLDKVIGHIKGGKSFVFLLHWPKSRWLNDRRYHKRHEEYMNRLINMFPDAPWMYLRKWRPKF